MRSTRSCSVSGGHCESIDRLPAQDQHTFRLYAQTLAGTLQRILSHDLERPLAHIAKGRGIGHRLVNIEQQQASNLWRFPLPSHLLRNEILVGPLLTLVLELLHVVTRSVDKIVGELAIALPGVAQEVQMSLLGLEAAQVVDGVKDSQIRVIVKILL